MKCLISKRNCIYVVVLLALIACVAVLLLARQQSLTNNTNSLTPEEMSDSPSIKAPEVMAAEDKVESPRIGGTNGISDKPMFDFLEVTINLNDRQFYAGTNYKTNRYLYVFPENNDHLQEDLKLFIDDYSDYYRNLMRLLAKLHAMRTWNKGENLTFKETTKQRIPGSLEKFSYYSLTDTISLFDQNDSTKCEALDEFKVSIPKDLKVVLGDANLEKLDAFLNGNTVTSLEKLKEMFTEDNTTSTIKVDGVIEIYNYATVLMNINGVSVTAAMYISPPNITSVTTKSDDIIIDYL